MNELNPKQRLLAALNKNPVDRPPVICMGGMMNAAVTEIVKGSEARLPAAHFDAALMATLVGQVQVATGFENYGIPFCMTIEAEALGSQIDPGTELCEPKVAKEIFPSVDALVKKNIKDICDHSRVAVVVEAIRQLAGRNSGIPVVASLTGPVSTAASIVDPMTFLKEMRKNPEGVHRLMSYVTAFLKEFAGRAFAAGADVVAIGDPTATGEILGPRAFEEFAVRYINELTTHIRALGGRSIIHICGDMSSSRRFLGQITADAVSVDANVNLVKLKEEFPGLVAMGNLSTYLLEWGPAEKIAQIATKLAADGIDIVSPACGLSCSTRINHIRAMTNAVRKEEPAHAGN
ncbi:MAG: uroporphyrinogen decarboxylase family protein [Lentisphaerota bacterium]